MADVVEVIIQPEKWVDNYANAMYRYLMLRVKYKEVAEDIIQETFIAALSSKNKFEGKSSEKTWLFSIMKFKIADYYRKHYKNSNAENNSDESFLDNYFDKNDTYHWRENTKPLTWHNDVEDAFEQEEFKGVLADCVQKVPTKTGSVFTLKYLEDLDSEEICEILNISEANLWTLMHRSKLLLRGCLEKNWFVKL